MARTIRFHLDENCHPAIAGGLKRRGVDVTTTPEVGLLHASDDKQIAYALPLRRVIFTQDRDFLKLHAASVSHAGIAYCDKDTKSISEIITMLILIWEIYEPEEMANRVEYI
jgi:predicted nuclease of predicted toxin-antitoxin system